MGSGPRAGSSSAADSGITKGPWTADEDQMLVSLVHDFGARNWTTLAAKLTMRSGKQCRERWLNHLNPDISKEPWSEQEDEVLISAHERLGNKWSEISKLLPGRTDNSIKNRWNSAIRKKMMEEGRFSQHQEKSSSRTDKEESEMEVMCKLWDSTTSHSLPLEKEDYMMNEFDGELEVYSPVSIKYPDESPSKSSLKRKRSVTALPLDLKKKKYLLKGSPKNVKSLMGIQEPEFFDFELTSNEVSSVTIAARPKSPTVGSFNSSDAVSTGPRSELERSKVVDAAKAQLERAKLDAVSVRDVNTAVEKELRASDLFDFTLERCRSGGSQDEFTALFGGSGSQPWLHGCGSEILDDFRGVKSPGTASPDDLFPII
eukprot:CAMPEP_0184678340 /NCGR_PEP_ID=MMETSP0312-20130426/1073_1 /TAXON_ID=31354 /ORGANISM="Compsopogon coeruleus, Strain SAG 36.94" /LENGTH=372 /DNA_ID=CAMNT_0027127009 /DNA_START=225 /DNA_END=1343 /DNA_ORIENTATION=+